MVVNIEASRFQRDSAASVALPVRRAMLSRRAERLGRPITIGLLNNMAGAAFKATERQFLSLLDASSEGLPIHVSFYTLPGLSIAEAGGSHFASHYESVESLWNRQLDGLIVTGREPKMASLRDEPYWQSFAQVLEWARSHTRSTVWSCLAAHAAVLHLDGIERRKNEEKQFGVFECEQLEAHPLIERVGPRFAVPHSRWNGVEQRDLTAHGYRVLSRIVGDGVDTFIKQEKSLFVFFQGHLEYETDTLLREYRRDVGRYLRGEAECYPLLPHGYFDADTESRLDELRGNAMKARSGNVLASVTAELEDASIARAWQGAASGIYRNWLKYIDDSRSIEDSTTAARLVLSR